MPLAIELAAARTKLLSVDEINARLDDRFRLLTGGSKSALPRHQTLRATIAWSYEHLTEEERQLFRILAVFKGGCTLAAATAVAGESADEFEVLELLGRLVDKSLVQVDKLADGTTRYSMLETVRQYAQEKLSESGEMDTARNRHLAFFLTFTEKWRERRQRGREEEYYVQLEHDMENILLAFEWCDRAEGGGEKGLRLINYLARYGDSQGLYDMSYRLQAAALARPDAQEKTEHRAYTFLHFGITAYRLSRHGESRSHVEESLEIFRARGDRNGVARALNWLAHGAVALGNLAEARKIKEEALQVSRKLGEKSILWSALTSMSELERFEGNLEAGQPLYEEALEIARELGSPFTIRIGVCNLSALLVQKGNLGEASKLVAEAIEISSDISDTLGIVQTLDIVAALASASGDLAISARFAGTCEAEMNRLSISRDVVDENFYRYWINHARESLGSDAFAAAGAAGRELSVEQALAEARGWIEKN
jgi:non-specific serine/threonine protein kinase